MEETGRSRGGGAKQLHVTNISLSKDGGKTQMYRTVFWTLWEKARVG